MENDQHGWDKDGNMSESIRNGFTLLLKWPTLILLFLGFMNVIMVGVHIAQGASFIEELKLMLYAWGFVLMFYVPYFAVMQSIFIFARNKARKYWEEQDKVK